MNAEPSSSDDELYLLRLTTGEIIQFAHAQELEDHIALTDCRILFPPELTCSAFPHGMDIRKECIVWESYGGLVAGY